MEAHPTGLSRPKISNSPVDVPDWHRIFTPGTRVRPQILRQPPPKPFWHSFGAFQARRLTSGPKPERTGAESRHTQNAALFSTTSGGRQPRQTPVEHQAPPPPPEPIENAFTRINNGLKIASGTPFLPPRYRNKKGRRNALNSKTPEIRAIIMQNSRKTL